MIRNPILKVLSSIRRNGVRALLMGGQACVFYGAAEFSRDTDFAILATPRNLSRLRKAMNEFILTCFADSSVNALSLSWLKWETNRHWPTLFCKKNEPKGPLTANIGRRSSENWNNCV